MMKEKERRDTFFRTAKLGKFDPNFSRKPFDALAAKRKTEGTYLDSDEEIETLQYLRQETKKKYESPLLKKPSRRRPKSV